MKKDHVRVEACGDVDELNASLGILATKIPDSGTEIQGEIQGIQSTLFYAGATLATTPGSPLLSTLQKIGGDDIRALERAIDRMFAFQIFPQEPGPMFSRAELRPTSRAV